MARTANPGIRVDLLRAAESVFVSSGLDGAKIEQITAKAGVSKGAFYLHFASKEDAFRQIVESLVARLATVLEEFPRPSTSSSLGEYLALCRDQDVLVFEVLWQNRGVARLLLEGGKSASFAYLVDAFAEGSRLNMKESLVEGQACGYFHADLDIELVSLMLAGAYDRVARALVRMQRRPNLVEWAEKMQLTLFGGIATTVVRSKVDRRVKNSTNNSRAKPESRPRARRSA